MENFNREFLNKIEKYFKRENFNEKFLNKYRVDFLRNNNIMILIFDFYWMNKKIERRKQRGEKIYKIFTSLIPYVT